jgi:serine protease Do
MKLNGYKLSLVVFLTSVWVLPVFGVNHAGALSSKSVPLGSNIFVEIAKRQNPAVVNISTKTKSQKPHLRTPAPSPSPNPRGRDPFQDFYDRFFGDRNNQRPKRGMGSGFFIEKEGLILTNHHVVDGAGEILVTIEDGHRREKEFEAKLIGSDPKTDIALLKVIQKDGESLDFPYLKFGNSDELEVGEWVVAIGNPFGLSHTVTVGVVSAKDRSIGAGPYDEYIQTDASINPGNSGGPLMNIKGEVIGINTAIISGNSGGNVGIGFAIPINVAKGIVKQLREKGKVTRGWLGVMIQKITPELAESFNLSSTEGALVGDVIPDGPAEKAGIKTGDVIVSFNNQAVDSFDALPKIVASTTPGKAVPVVVVRDGKNKTIQVTIEVLKDEKLQVATEQEDPFGIQVQYITPEIAQSLELDSDEGVLVSNVIPGEPGGESGLRRGDVISEVNRKPVRNVADYNKLVRKLKTGDTALMLVRRGGTTIYVAVKLK